MKTPSLISINHHLKLIIISVLLGLCIFACNENTNENSKQAIAYEEIGKEHNNGLDFVFNYLKKNNFKIENNSTDQEAIFKIANHGTLMFTNESDFFTGIEKEKIILTFFTNDLNLLKSLGANELASSIESEIELSAIQISFFNQLDDIMSELGNGLELTIEKINELEAEIINLSPQTEAEVLLISTSLARHSLDYWYNNFQDWISEFVNDSTISQKIQEELILKSTKSWLTETLVAMGKSDVVGGAIGAGVGALAVGVGAAPGAVAGACYSSAGRGIVALLDHWEIW